MKNSLIVSLNSTRELYGTQKKKLKTRIAFVVEKKIAPVFKGFQNRFDWWARILTQLMKRQSVIASEISSGGRVLTAESCRRV